MQDTILGLTRRRRFIIWGNTGTSMSTFNDTTNLNGLIQIFERQTGLGNTAVSGNANLLKIVTALFNDSFDEIMPLLLSYSDHMRWDDLNHTDLPIGTLNIVNVRISTTSSGTEYETLTRMTLDDERALDPMSSPATE